MFIFGAFVFGGFGSILAYKLGANQVAYSPSDSTWNVSKVDTALDDLYDLATYGNAQASDILERKTALVNGNYITGNLTIPNYTAKTGTQSVNPESSYSFTDGYYNMSNYKVSCTSCPSCPRCNSCCNLNYATGSFNPINGTMTVDTGKTITQFLVISGWKNDESNDYTSRMFYYVKDIHGNWVYKTNASSNSWGVQSVNGSTFDFKWDLDMINKYTYWAY